MLRTRPPLKKIMWMNDVFFGLGTLGSLRLEWIFM